MAKDAERKRKLEHDQLDQTTTPKRMKPSKGDSTKKAAPKTNGADSPQVVVARQSSLNATAQPDEAPILSRTQRKAATKKAKRDAESFLKDMAREIPSSSAEQHEEEPSPRFQKHKHRKYAEDVEEERDEIRVATPAKANGIKTETQTVVKTEDIEQADPGAVQTKPKKSKKRKSQQQDALVPSQDVQERRNSVADVLDTSVSSKKEKKAKKALDKSVATFDVGEAITAPNAHGWSLSPPAAGRYLNHDSLFVQDENDEDCLIAATVREVQLLSLETSLMIRSHIVPDGRSIVCYSRSASDPDSVDLAYDNGTRVQWNWITEAVVRGTFPAQENIVALTTSTAIDDSLEQFYITCSDDGYHSIIGDRKALYTTQRRLNGIKVLHEGVYIVCLSATALILGARKAPDQPDYTWVEVPVDMPLHCFDARTIFSRPDKKKQSKRPELTVAVGNAEGQIHLYSDLSTLFVSPSQITLPAPRVLHWHRNAVSTVKFSQDGHYLISGGKETVLVLWQLETGKQQHLPHLGSEVERVVVSPDGTRYALHMGDNSIMVLSTTELNPVANFAGLQLPVVTESMVAQGIMLPRTNAILHPKDPYQLLMTVPSTQPKTVQDVATRPFLQAFDIRNSRHISRQALSRNNITDFTTGPEKTLISPPDVALMAVSTDGKWLATVDEWVPPGTDLEHVLAKTAGLDIAEVIELREEQQRRREIHLKFWRWDEAQEMWTLSTRADSPHALSSSANADAGPGRILKLVSDPTSNSFATIGEDSKIKVWRPTTRTRHGVPLKEADGRDSIDYVCRHTVPLPVPSELPDRADSPMEDAEDNEKEEILEDACLVYSQDGSMLACAQVSNNDNALPLVHFISPKTGVLITSKAGLVAAEQELLDFGFLDRYFISLSTGSVRVWNLIDDSHHFTIGLSAREDQENAVLALNHFDETFAIVSYDPVRGTDEPTPKVQVYSTKAPQCLFDLNLVATPAAILAGNGVKGFTILFEDGTIRTLSSSTASSVRRGSIFDKAITEDPVTNDSALAIVEDTEGDQLLAGMGNLALPAGEAIGDNVEDDRPVIRPEQLAGVLDVGQSFALPPVRDMFQNVVELFARKPRRNLVSAVDDMVMIDA
ncbi:U3 small nucleolar RNA-associated protein 17 [Fulvia fulva]|uniref:U3 small nucleolar RNA-associated protein 17 n=1 Tax=Passalora fulva TaxID=5499 RepID=A0A9Q8URP2_PASFU|nr:U3 small nucleolar RNA-associated protein 17 [Fulvia fulva]KAK4620228.1 U3 small nucleolar RNA-associated protein 17 [Fulvia fulva]KAK4620660.1 U3 small nucleolar RNA-associated protein 17 [Fulvia fulva]UJO19931.1 U3 small nucleolar RNA-associated protein 17 [Fulvia fulva]WPV17473.1 U3 small nucleolar RNA-associated protein 17 [Fulvia fulva]WPV32592.1 U3 small nucleolar RNA-associated protein 17 [Fulvia fulva]